MSLLKAESFLQLVSEKEVRKLKHERNSTWGKFSVAEGGQGHGAKTSERPLAAERGSHLTRGREQGSQSYQHKKLNSANNLNEPRSGLLSRAFRQELSLTDPLIAALWNPEQRIQPCTAWLLTYKTVMGVIWIHSTSGNLLHRERAGQRKKERKSETKGKERGKEGWKEGRTERREGGKEEGTKYKCVTDTPSSTFPKLTSWSSLQIGFTSFFPIFFDGTSFQLLRPNTRINPWLLSFLHKPHLNCQEVLLALLSKYIQVTILVTTSSATFVQNPVITARISGCYGLSVGPSCFPLTQRLLSAQWPEEHL